MDRGPVGPWAVGCGKGKDKEKGAYTEYILGQIIILDSLILLATLHSWNITHVEPRS